MRTGAIAAILIGAAVTLGTAHPAFSADAAFTQFIASLWPDAQAAGVSRATFDAETAGLEPDYKLPDLMLPGRPATGAPSQAEFVQVPADYVKEATIARLAAEGQRLMQKHRAALTAIEKRFGVPAHRHAGDLGPRDRLRPLPAALRRAARAGDAGLCRPAQGPVPQRVHSRAEDSRRGRRRAQGFPRVLGRRHRLTQFLPSEFYKHGVDFDGDGRVDIWHSVPDALASAAQQLVNKGWQPGLRWAYEVRAPANVDCTHGRARGDEADRRMAARGLRAGARTKAERGRAGAAGLAAAAGGHLRPGVPDHEELLRHQGIQFLRSLRAVRRPSRRPHDQPAAVRDAMVGIDAVAQPPMSRRCSAI